MAEDPEDDRKGTADWRPTINQVLREYQVATSAPTYGWGRCVACDTTIPLPPTATLAEDPAVECTFCGARASRRRLIQQALMRIDSVAWSFFASDILIWDRLDLGVGDIVSYNVQLSVAKWQHYEAQPTQSSGSRYVANISFYDPTAYLFLSDIKAGIQPPEAPPPTVNVFWHRFGLTSTGSVPAWRQALYGAMTLLAPQPAAAAVLIAGGFEAFFNETTRIAWGERGLDGAGYERLASRNLAITSIIDWLPEALGKQGLRSAPGDLRSQWEKSVNRLRNDVVHRADVNVTTEQAIESLTTALSCISFLDEFAFVRPHAYYTNR